MSEEFDLGGGGQSFPFDNPGDSVTGFVKSMSNVQSRDMATGELSTWPDGRPKMMFQVILATELREDPMDSGERSVYLNGSRKPESKSKLAAVLAAVMSATGGTNLSPGGKLTLTYTGDGPRTKAGFNAPKQYTAAYVPPSAASTNLASAGQQVPAGEPPF